MWEVAVCELGVVERADFVWKIQFNFRDQLVDSDVLHLVVELERIGVRETELKLILDLSVNSLQSDQHMRVVSQ